MSRRLFPILLEHRLRGDRVKGLITSASIHDVLAWADWQYSPDDKDKDWDWLGLYLESLSSEGRFEYYSSFAFREVQGLMRLDLGLQGARPSRPVIVDYLATNPANRAHDSGLRYVGVTLMAVAVMRSIALGRGGRIVLESLPGAEPFYISLGMRKLKRTSAEGYSIFTLTKGGARQLLDEIRKKRIISI